MDKAFHHGKKLTSPEQAADLCQVPLPLPNINTIPFLSYWKLNSCFSFKTQNKQKAILSDTSFLLAEWLQVCLHFFFCIRQC